MIGHARAAILAALGVLAGLPDPAAAAADNTLGMALMSARVGGNANLAAGAGAESAVRIAPQGQYRVTFARELTVTACTATATIIGPGPSGEQGFIAADINSSGNLLVRTYAANAAFEDRSFSVIVFCHK